MSLEFLIQPHLCGILRIVGFGRSPNINNNKKMTIKKKEKKWIIDEIYERFDCGFMNWKEMIGEDCNGRSGGDRAISDQEL